MEDRKPFMPPPPPHLRQVRVEEKLEAVEKNDENKEEEWNSETENLFMKAESPQQESLSETKSQVLDNKKKKLNVETLINWLGFFVSLALAVLFFVLLIR